MLPQKSESVAISFDKYLMHLIANLMDKKKSILQEIRDGEKEIQQVKTVYEQFHQYANMQSLLWVN